MPYCDWKTLQIFGLIILFAIGVIFLGSQLRAQEPKRERVTPLEEGVYVIDVRDAMNDAHLGWASLLVQFKKDHPDRRVIAIAPASISGGRGTMNSVVLLTELAK